MPNSKSNAGSFKKGRKKTGGRTVGAANKLTRDIKEAILEAGDCVGYDGKGRGGLKGFLGLQEVVWVFWATSEGWKHACEHLEPQIFLVA